MALAYSGAVYCWGWGSYGNLGDGQREDRRSPVKVCSAQSHWTATPGALQLLLSPCCLAAAAFSAVAAAF
jgi:hypothetical protein